MSLMALSLWQPWCAVICGSTELPAGLGKRLENRTKWAACNYRGPLLIHASHGFGGLEEFHQTVDAIRRIVGVRVGQDLLGMAVDQAGPVRPRWVPAPELVRGALVGRCRLVGTIENETQFQRYVEDVSLGVDRAPREAQRAWWYGGFALVLADVERLVQPIPYKGHQKLFRVHEKVLDGADWVPVP